MSGALYRVLWRAVVLPTSAMTRASVRWLPRCPAVASAYRRVRAAATLWRMTMPHDPGETPPPPQYVQGPPQSTETRTRITGGAHTAHLVLTVCTCGTWGVVWFLHWLFTRNKTVHR